MPLKLVFVLWLTALQTCFGELVSPSDFDVLEQSVDMQVRGQFPDAERLLRSLLARSDLAPQSKARALNELGLILGATGRYDEAERAFQQAIRTAETSSDLPEILPARARMNLAAIYLECGREKAAREQLQRIAHPDELKELYATQWLSIQAAAAMVGGDLKTSKQLFSTHLSLLRSLRPAPQNEVATTLNNLGTICLSLHENGAAVRYLSEAASVWRSAVGVQHPSMLRTLANLAIAQQKQHDYEGARATLAECLASLPAQSGLATPFTAALYLQYSDVLGKLGSKREAAEMRRVAERLRREQSPALPENTVVDVSAFRRR